MMLSIDGVNIHYDIKGEGEPILLLHGWGGCIGSFAPVADFLAQDHRVISLDFPGHGESDEPPVPWSVTEYTEMTRRFMEELNIAPAHIVAHSFGGRVAILLSSTWPELVKKMVLCDSAGILPKRTAKYYFKVYKHKLGKRLAKIKWLDQLLGLSERAKNAGSADYRALSDSMKGTFVRVVNQDLAPRLPLIQAETLLVWGSEDTATPLSDGKRMEKDIPGAGLVVFEGAGHFSYLDEFGRFCAVLKVFFGGKNA